VRISLDRALNIGSISEVNFCMPGIAGVVHAQEQRCSKSLLTNMAAALKDFDWYQDALYTGNDVGLGRVSLALRSQQSQPVWIEA
jgi:hypothetical protein